MVVPVGPFPFGKTSAAVQDAVGVRQGPHPAGSQEGVCPVKAGRVCAFVDLGFRGTVGAVYRLAAWAQPKMGARTLQEA